MIAILEAMLINKMIVASAGGPFVFGASATTGPESPGIDEKEPAAARDLGKRIAEVAAAYKPNSKAVTHMRKWWLNLARSAPGHQLKFHE